MQLDNSKEAPPLYVQLKEILKEKIESGEYAPGDVIPSEAELQKYYQVSRITVRQALKELVLEGYLSRQRGKGTIVLKRIEENLFFIKSFTNEMKERGLQPGTIFMDLTMEKADKKIAKELEVKEGEPVCKLFRVRSANGVPIVVFVTYLHKDVNLSLEKIREHDSLYQVFKLENKLIKKVKEYIEADIADRFLSKHLKVKVGDPILKRIRTSYDQNLRPLEYTECFYNAKLYRYKIESS